MEKEVLRKIEKRLDEADACAHVIIEAGVIPGISYSCRCDECRLVAKSMDEAGYMDGVHDRWWED